jgi:hypothetical protein
MEFADISAILAEINKLATGQETDTEIVDTSSFVSVAQAAQLTGNDNFTGAISQALARTIFAVRPYDAPLQRLQVSAEEYGNHTRKINYFDDDPVKDAAWALQDGQSVDMYEVHKPKILQTNYYGQTNYSRVYTLADTQLKAAFTGPDQLAEFWSNMVQHMANQIESDRANLATNLLVNHLTGVTKTSPTSVVYLLDEYNALNGTSLTPATVFQQANFSDFAEFAYARINDVSRMMKRRSINWHQNWQISGTNYNFMRHTPYDRQHLYLYSYMQDQINARVIPATFHDQMLKYRDVELIDMWQSLDERDTINATPVITTAAGATQKAAGVKLTNVFGCLIDWDALGYSPIDNAVLATPMNARGRYTNFWYHYNWRWWADFTENAVLFLLTTSDVGTPAGRAAAPLKSSTVKDPDPAKS